jgi:hypothetical protein
MTDQICASDGCRNTGTHRCSRCTTTCYCSRTCQKASWKEHKLTCNKPETFPPLRPGIFDFMRLPREVRDKVYDMFFFSWYLLTDTNGYRSMLKLSTPSSLPLSRLSMRSYLLLEVNRICASDVETAWTCSNAI